MPRSRVANLVGTISGTSLNVASITLTSGLDVSNQANNAYAQANLAYGQANSSYSQANLAYTQANNAYGQANLSYTQANNAYGQANLAYTAANNRVLKAGDTMTGQLNISSGGLLVTGNVGIGNSSPTNLLELYNATNATLRVSGDSTSQINVDRAITSGSAALMNLRKSRGTISSPTAVASGDGIGNYLFTAYGGTNYSQIAAVSGFVGTYTSDSDVSSFLTFSTTPTGSVTRTERMRIDSAGNVGIGTVPSHKLHVYSAINNRATFETGSGGGINYLRLLSNNGGGNYGSAIEFRDGSTDSAQITSVASGQLRFSTAGTERVTIDGSGNVGIGTASPTAKLHVYTTTNYTGNLTFDGVASIGPVLNIEASGNVYTEFRLGSWALTRAKLRVEGYSGAGSGTGGGTLSLWTGDTSGVQQQRVTIDGAGSVGIGTTSPASKLSVGGNPPNPGVIAGVSAANNISLALSDNINNSFYVKHVASGAATIGTDAGGQLAFATNGFTERVRIDASGNVGIGTTSASNKLEVSGTLYHRDNYASIGGFNSGGQNTPFNRYGATFGTNITNGQAETDIWNPTDPATYTSTGILFCQALSATTRRDLMFLKHDGNVGIGTTSPSSKLHVKEGSNAIEVYPSGIWAGQVFNANDGSTSHGLVVGNRWAGTASSIFEVGSLFGGNTGSWRQFFRIDGVGQVFFSNEGSERMRLTTSGELNIGSTANYGGLVSINRSQTSSNANFLTMRCASSGSTLDFRVYGDPTFGSAHRQDFSGAYYAFRAGTTEHLRILSGGNVGIGTISPGSKLTVAGNASTWVHINGGNSDTVPFLATINNETLSSATYGWLFYNNATNGNLDLYRRVNSTTDVHTITFGRASGEVYIAGTTDNGAYNLQVNGTGIWAAGAYVNGSDRRLKRNIKPLGSTLALINNLKPVIFQYNEDYSKDQSIQPGFIAQDLQEALSGTEYIDGVVHQGKEYLNVAYQNLIPLLTKAIQELKNDNDNLRSRLEALENK